MNELALSLLGLGPTATRTVKGRVVTSALFTGNVVRERIEKLSVILADNLGHDTHALARRIGATTKQTQQALTKMVEDGTARKAGMAAHGLSRVTIWRKV